MSRALIRDGLLSLALYASPVALMFAALALTGQQPWNVVTPSASQMPAHALSWEGRILHQYWLPLFVLALGIVEFSFGLYEAKWTKNERFLDIVSFAAPYVITAPAIAYFSVKVLPVLLPDLRNQFAWVPFFWALLIICVADDLTQYWYHRLHHQVPWLWRFHRAHHSASYMGMAMANRQNLIYSIFFSQLYLTAALVYLGLGAAAAVALAAKSVITTLAHSSIPWDKPLYKYRALHPFAWLLDGLSPLRQLTMRTMLTPATMGLAITKGTSETCSSCGTCSSEPLIFRVNIPRRTAYRIIRGTRGTRSSCGPFSSPT